MKDIREVKNLVLAMTADTKRNVKKIKSFFGSLDYKDEENQSILHILVDKKYDEEKCFLAIQSLFQIGFSPNLKDDFNYIFIQTALYSGYSESFIIRIIKESLLHGLNVNHTDDDKDTIMHTAIYSDNYLGEIIGIYRALTEAGFDSSQVDGNGRNLVDAMIYQKQYTENQIATFKKLYSSEVEMVVATPKNSAQVLVSTKRNIGLNQLSATEIQELENQGEILNKKEYLSPPTIGREKELKNLMIALAQHKKNPLLVGESGVGKTIIVDELAYRIQNNLVPDFLRDKIILEVAPNEVVSGRKYVGEFEESMKNLIKLCKKYEIILFIDEIHTIFGVGSSSKKDIDMADILKRHLDRADLKIIGTTTPEEYTEYFSTNALRRRFEKIIIKEPQNEILTKIVNKIMDDYCLIDGLFFENDYIKEKITAIIIEMTERQNRTYQDIRNNPDLSVEIIDRAFAGARYINSELIEPNHFIESVECCSIIGEYSKLRAINKLKNLKGLEKRTEKILKVDFKNKGK